MSFSLSEYEDRLIPWSDLQGHMPFLRETAEGYDKPTIIEFGVRSGQSTSCFLAAIAKCGGEIWSIDVDPAQVPAHWHDLPHWHFLQADDVSPEAQAWLPAEVDVLFIDTDHSYWQTMAELRLYVPRVRPGGVVLLHDTEWLPPGHATDFPTGTVTEALNAYCEEAGLSWVNRTGSYGLGIIRR